MKRKMNFYALIKLQSRSVKTWTWREMAQFVMDIAMFNNYQVPTVNEKIRLIKSILVSKRIRTLEINEDEL